MILATQSISDYVGKTHVTAATAAATNSAEQLTRLKKPKYRPKPKIKKD